MNDLHAQGEIIADRYQIVTTLGHGSMGTTYAAVDLKNSEQVAIKVVSLRAIREWKILELFEREAKILETLQHEAIPKYLDYFDLDTDRDRRFYLVQELISGQSLATLLEQGWHPKEQEVTAIALQILNILDYLHTRIPPVIHRDIKPQNLIRTETGKIVLVDFGSVQEAFQHTLSRGGTFVGTIDYLPPEQFRGQATAASDLYSLGITLVDLLTGATPLSELPVKRLKFDFRAVVKVSPHFARWLDTLIEPTIEDRFQSVAIAQAALTQPQPAEHTTIATIPVAHQTVLHRTEHYLSVEIPPARWSLLSRALWIFNLALSGIWTLVSLFIVLVISIGIGALLEEFKWEGIAAIFLMSAVIGGFWAVPWLLWRTTRRLRGDTIELELDPGEFRLRCRSFPLSQTVRGDVRSLTILPRTHAQGLDLLYFSRDRPLRCSQWGWRWRSRRKFKYRFGKHLPAAEQAWLAQELYTFTEAMKAPERP